MTAEIVPFGGQPSAEFLQRRLRELAVESGKLVFDHPHFKANLLARGLSMRHVLETVRKGNVVHGPIKDDWGDWRIKVSRLVSGRRVQVVVAYKGDHFVIVTVI